MEEFTKNEGGESTNDIILPAEKKLTLEPIHDNVHMDEESDVQIAASHANGSPIGNIASDTETTGETADTQTAVAAPASDEYVAPKKEPRVVANRHPYRMVVILAVVVVVLIAILLIR